MKKIEKESVGFPTKFIKSKKYLCAYNNNRELIKDAKSTGLGLTNGN